MAKRTPKRVALILDEQIEHGRQLVAGVAHYLKAAGPWELFGFPPYVAPSACPIAHWRGDGIIGVVGFHDLTPSILSSLSMPVVNVGHDFSTSAPTIHVDDEAVGVTTAQYFLNHNHRRFAFLGLLDESFTQRRLKGFEHTLAKDGFTCLALHAKASNWIRQLQAQPKPMALMAATDLWAYVASQECMKLGLAVPADVAIVGVDNDTHFCEFARPPLSSVEPAFERVGYLAAQTLDRMMQGEPVDSSLVLFPPLDVVERESSSHVAVDDPLIKAARQYIYEHSDRAIQVPDVACAVKVSTKTLQRRYRQTLGRPVLHDIHAAHLERAQRLLCETTLSIEAVARASGLCNARELARMFRRLLGVSPSAYRNDFRDPTGRLHPKRRPALSSPPVPHR